MSEEFQFKRIADALEDIAKELKKSNEPKFYKPLFSMSDSADPTRYVSKDTICKKCGICTMYANDHEKYCTGRIK